MKMDYTKMKRTVKCPICGKNVSFDEEDKLPPSFPFCSKRCKLIDLRNWLNEEYALTEPIPGKYEPADDDDEE